jgi:hypothetical protein
MSADDQDRLSFGEGPLGGPIDEDEPEEEAARRPNRTFVYIAIAMAGLVLLGILAVVAAVTLWLPAQREAQIAAVTSTVVAITREAAAWTPTPTSSPTPLPPTVTATSAPTQTPEPTATSTRVVRKDDQAQQPTKTPQPGSGTGTGTGTTPAAGLGGLGIAAIGVGLAGLLVVARKLRK